MALSAAASLQLSRIGSGREASCSGGSSGSATSGPLGRPAAPRAQQQPRPASSSAQALRQACLSRAAPRRGSLLAAAAAAPEAAPGGELVVDRQGYRSFQLEGCEFLVAESADGLLDLADVYVASTSGSGDGDDAAAPAPAYRRPEGHDALGALPPPRRYHAVEWTTKWDGNVFKEEPAREWIWRYYLVPLMEVGGTTQEPDLQLDLDADIFQLDAKAQRLQRCEVHHLAPPGTPRQALRLRIRADVVTVDVDDSVPTWEHVVRARAQGIPALSELEAARLREYLAALEAARQQGTIDEAEFETAYDVHWLAGITAGAGGTLGLAEGWDKAGAEGGGGAELELEGQADVMGGWDDEAFKDLIQEYDDEAEEAEFDDYDAPATDY